MCSGGQLRIKRDKSVDGPHPDSPIRGSQSRFIIKLIIRQPIVSGKDLQAVCFRMKANQSTVCSEPDAMLCVFHHFIGHVVRKTVRFSVCPEPARFGVKTQ